MVINLLIALGILTLLSSLVYLFGRIQHYVRQESEKKNQKKEIKEASQSIITGFLVLAVSLILGLIHRPLLFLSLAGVGIIFSGTRWVKKNSSEKAALLILKDVRIGLAFFGFGLLLFVIVLAGGKDRNYGKAPAPRRQARIEKGMHKTVRRMGYVRSKASGTGRIVGVSIAHSKVEILGTGDGYCYVKGFYRAGKDGKGGRKQGKFWIGRRLLK